jgi:hypothetical protein
VDHAVIEVLVFAILSAESGDVDRGERLGANSAHVYLFIIKEIVEKGVEGKGKAGGRIFCWASKFFLHPHYALFFDCSMVSTQTGKHAIFSKNSQVKIMRG